MTASPTEERIRQALPHFSEQQVAELTRVIENLVAALAPERIYLFGSQARGEATPDSDVDLLLVVPNTTESVIRLDQLAYRVAGPRSFAMDMMVMPHDEFERRSRALASLPATILREGHILYAA